MSQDDLLLPVPKDSTEMGDGAFKYAAPHAENSLQNHLKMKDLVSLNILEANASDCRCSA